MTDTVQEIAFRYAVDRVNLDRDTLPRSRLTAQIERIPQQDSFYASKQGKKKYFGTLFECRTKALEGFCTRLSCARIFAFLLQSRARQVKPKLLDYMLYKKPSLDQQDVAEEKELFTPYIVAWEREIAVVKEVFSRTPKSAK